MIKYSLILLYQAILQLNKFSFHMYKYITLQIGPLLIVGFILKSQYHKLPSAVRHFPLFVSDYPYLMLCNMRNHNICMVKQPNSTFAVSVRHSNNYIKYQNNNCTYEFSNQNTNNFRFNSAACMHCRFTKYMVYSQSFWRICILQGTLIMYENSHRYFTAFIFVFYLIFFFILTL